jgi:aspartate aminotransferase-like enzyme
MGEAGWIIGSGYGDLKTSTIRLGHMGDHTVEQLDDLLGVLEGVVS